MSDVLDYEALVAGFEHSLLTQLRGHSAAAPFLEGWVPDEDPVRGILNMLEAAEIAGEGTIALRVRHDTLPAGRLPEIQEFAEEFGRLTIAEEGDSWQLTITAIGFGQMLRPIAPAYRAALRERLGRLDHTGRLKQDSGSQQLLTIDQDGYTLSALIDTATQLIADACHDGPNEPVTRAVLDYFCEVLAGLTVQEASDHAGHHLIVRLTAPDAPRPVPGIVLPDNADGIFRLPKALARSLLAQWRVVSGYAGRENEFTTAPDSPWARLSAPQRADAVAAALDDGSAIPKDSLQLVTMEPNILGHEVRAVIAFAETVAPEDKPGLARRAELHLKRALDPHIELYVEELKDQNVIRRL